MSCIKENISYWRKNPDKFVEKYLGCKLYPYQKFLLKIVFKNKKDKYKEEFFYWCARLNYEKRYGELKWWEIPFYNLKYKKNGR